MVRKEYERVTPESVGLPSKAIGEMIDRLNKVTEMHGLIVMRHGKICAEGWWSPFGPGVRHALHSHTKTYIATAIGIAYTEGKLKLDERLIDIFPDKVPVNVSENLKKLTLYNVLTMGNGMEVESMGAENWISRFLSTPVIHEPGTTFFYNSAGSCMLGAVIKAKTGMSVEDYLSEKLFKKLGIDSDNIGYRRGFDGNLMGGGGMLATLEDNLRLMDLYRQGGVWEGERLLAEDFVKMATTKQIETYNAMTNGPLATDHNLGYGFQMWMCQPEGAYRADGAFGQYTIVFPKYDMIIAINESGAQDDNGTQRPLDAVYPILESIAQDAIPENAEDCRKLRYMLSHLAITRPEYKPYSPISHGISGKWFRVVSGDVSIWPEMYRFFKTAPCISEFKFDFGVNECTLTYFENGTERKLDIAMDGTRRLNIAERLDYEFHKCYASAYWVEDKKLRVVLRWIESAYEHRLTFKFDAPNVDIACDDLITSAPNDQTTAHAVRL